MSARIDNNLMQDFTVAINKVPRAWNLLDSMGIATTNGVSTETASVDVINERTNTFGDTRRGGERNSVKAENVITKNLTIPFFALDGAVRPSDLQNLRKFGTENDLQDVNSAVSAIFERIRRYQTALREKALVEAVKGSSYSPNGTTEVYDYYSTFEVTGKKLEVAFDLANATSNPISKSEEAFGHIIDNAEDGASSYEVMALCSPEFFSKLLENDILEQAYTYYASTQEPLRNRQGGGSIYREFVHGGIRYIEYRGAFNGTKLIPTDEAYFMPVGIQDMFQINHAPADHMDYVNTAGQEVYMWTYADPRGRKIDVESETALLAVNHRPELVVRATSAASF